MTLRAAVIALPLLLLTLGAKPPPTPEDVLRARLHALQIPSFAVKDVDGPALASALQTAVRAQPDGAAVNVLWQGEPAKTSPVTLDVKSLDAFSLLCLATRHADVFWGIRNGAVVVSAGPVLRHHVYATDPVLLSAQLRDVKKEPDHDASAEMQSMLPDVVWRPGENLRVIYEPATGKLRVSASEEAFPRVDQLITSLCVQARQVQLTATWVAYPAPLLEARLAARPAAALSQQDLRDLFAQPEKRVLYTQSVITLSGINAVAEGVDEIIYPTEFDVSESDITIETPEEHAAGTHYLIGTQIPGAFETREIGALFNITPTVNMDNETINLQLLPETAELVDWIEYGNPKKKEEAGVHQAPTSMRQPVFRSHNLTTSVTVRDGATLAMIAGRDPKTRDHLVLYIQAVILDRDGDPLR